MSNSILRSFVHMLSHHPQRQLRFTKLRFTGTPLLLGCLLISGACGTAFPPGALDWGHGAKPLAKGDARGQYGGGVGMVFLLPTENEPRLSSTPLLEETKTNGIAGFGAGAGASAEFQATKWLLLRADAAAGMEASILGGWGLVGAGYVGTQLNLTSWLAARARLGAGAALGYLLAPSPYLGGETGLVWSFLSSERWEGWVYGYGMGRVGVTTIWDTTRIPLFPGASVDVDRANLVKSRTFGAGTSVGFAYTDPSGISWYVSGRTDVPIFRVVDGATPPGSDLVMPTVGAQAGLTHRF